MGLYEHWPYVNFHELNMDFIIDLILKFREEYAQFKIDWAQIQEDWETQQQAFIELKNFVDNYFDNLDVQEEINNKLDEMAADGTLLEILSRYTVPVYPEMFGAVGDGVTDDTAAFTRMLSEAAYVILKPAKNYLLTDTIILKAGTHIDLNGSKITTAQQFLFHNFESSDVLTGYNGAGNILIENGNIEGGSMQFAHASNITIQNISYKHCEHDHFIEFCACENVKVLDSSFVGMPYFASSSLEYINIDPCINTSFPYFDSGSASYDGTPCKNILVRGCYLSTDAAPYNRMLNGIGCHVLDNSASLHSNIRILDNVIKGSTNSGISMLMMTESEAIGNTLDSEQSGFRVGRGNHNVIRNNHYMSNNSLIAMVNFWAPVTNISIYDNLIENLRTDITSGLKVITGTEHINNSSFIKLQPHYMGYGSGTTFNTDLNTTLFNKIIFDTGNVSTGTWVHHEITPYVNRNFQVGETFPYAYIDSANVTRGVITFAQNSMTSTHQLNYVWFGADYSHIH